MKYFLLSLSLVCCLNLFGQDDELFKTELVLERVNGFAANDRITDLRVNNNTVWIAGKSGIKSYDNKTLALDNHTNHANALAVVNVKDRTFSAYADNSIYLNESRIFKISEEGVRINDIELFKNRLWVGTTRGLYVINSKDGNVIKKYTHKTPIYDRMSSISPFTPEAISQYGLAQIKV